MTAMTIQTMPLFTRWDTRRIKPIQKKAPVTKK